MNKLAVSMCLLLLFFADAVAQDRSYAVSGLEKVLQHKAITIRLSPK